MTAQLRQWFYMLSALVSTVVPILVASKLVTEDQGNQWLGLLVAIGGLLGAGGAGAAGAVVAKQRKNGTLTTPATDKAVTSIHDVKAELDTLTQAAVDSVAKVQQTVGSVTTGSLTDQVIRSIR